MSSKSLTLGLISDTHGLMRPEALSSLQGVDRILHAGDIGSQDVLDALGAIAPVTAVRGNMDRASGWDRALPVSAVVEANDTLIYLLHDRAHLDLEPGAADIAVVVYGHSHRPFRELVGDTVFINPGSAGPRRFDYPVTVATLCIEKGSLTPRFIKLDLVA
jgi:putative phosphoesterase